MIYEFDERGEVVIFDTDNFDRDTIWDELGYRQTMRRAGDKVGDLFNSSTTFFNGILVVTSRSWMKPHDREAQRHQADHYLTRQQLEAAVGRSAIQRLIKDYVLELHPKWLRCLRELHKNERGEVVHDSRKHKIHAQAPYRLDIGTLHYIEAEAA